MIPQAYVRTINKRCTTYEFLQLSEFVKNALFNSVGIFVGEHRGMEIAPAVILSYNVLRARRIWLSAGTMPFLPLCLRYPIVFRGKRHGRIRSWGTASDGKAVSAFLMEKAPRPDRQRSTVPEPDYFISRLTAVIGSVQRSCITPPLRFSFGRLGIILRAGGCISAHCVGEYRRVWRNWQTRRI